MPFKITIEWDGIEEVVGNLESIGENARANLTKELADLSRDAEADWKEGTPVRTGRLMGADEGFPADLVITFSNDVFYYKFVDLGHRTPKGWRTAHGYRPAKRVSMVEGRLMTERLIKFLEANLADYLSKFLED